MKKLKLALDDLKVHSFETDAAQSRGGTVRGNENTGGTCPRDSEYWTCGIWCPETTNPQDSGPCNCNIGDTEAPYC